MSRRTQFASSSIATAKSNRERGNPVGCPYPIYFPLTASHSATPCLSAHGEGGSPMPDTRAEAHTVKKNLQIEPVPGIKCLLSIQCKEKCQPLYVESPGQTAEEPLEIVTHRSMLHESWLCATTTSITCDKQFNKTLASLLSTFRRGIGLYKAQFSGGFLGFWNNTICACRKSRVLGKFAPHLSLTVQRMQRLDHPTLNTFEKQRGEASGTKDLPTFDLG